MAQQNIDFGTFPDDPSADVIRVAFQKVQNNFTELFSDLSSNSVLSINSTPGAGVTVNSPTGNVVVSANIACVQVTSHTLAVGVNGSNNYGNAGGLGVITRTTDVLYIDLPSNVANITSIIVSGNITANNFTANNSFTTTSFIATGNVSGGNLISSGNVYANTGTANVQNLAASNGSFSANLTVTGNISAGNVSAGIGNLSGNLTAANANLGNVATANYFTGNGYYLTGVVATIGTTIANGTSNVSIPAAGGNVNTSVGGTANVLVVTSVGANVSSNLTVGNNIVASNVYANSGNINATLLGGTLTTAAQPNITSVGTLTGLNINGNITAANITANTGTFTGNGSGLNHLAGANVTGAVTLATTANAVAGANVTGQVGNALVASTVYTNAQPNITSVGTLSSLTVTGNISAGNVTSNFYGQGNNLSNIQGANVTGAVASATTATSATVAASANAVAGANVTGAVSYATTANAVAGANVSGQVNYAAIANSVAGANVSGAINLSTYATTANAVAGANVTGAVTSATNASALLANTSTATTAYPTFVTTSANGNSQQYINTSISANLSNAAVLATTFVGALSGAATSATTAGTVTTNAQPNITSVGTLSALSVTGNLSSGNANLGNLTKANFFQGDGGLLSNISVSGGTSIVSGNSNVTVAANSNVSFGIAGVANVLVVTTAGANLTGNLAAGNVSATLLTGTIATAAQPNITSLGSLTSLTVAGSANLGAVGNLILTGGSANQLLMSNGTGGATWTTVTSLTAAPGSNTQVLYNNAGSFAANAGFTFNYITNTVSITNALSVTGNANVGNIGGAAGVFTTVTGSLTTAAQPNITSVGSLTSLIVTGNISAGNISGGNLVSASYISGNGNSLFNIQGANIVGTVGAATNAAALQTNTSTATTVYPTFVTTSANGNSQQYINTSISANLANSSITATTFVGALSGAATSATTAGTVTTNAQPNITSVGSLTSCIYSCFCRQRKHLSWWYC